MYIFMSKYEPELMLKYLTKIDIWHIIVKYIEIMIVVYAYWIFKNLFISKHHLASNVVLCHFWLIMSVMLPAQLIVLVKIIENNYKHFVVGCKFLWHMMLWLIY